MKVNIAGLDPALSNLGIAKATYDTDTGEVEVTDLRLVQTESEATKTTRKNSDDMRRCSLLLEGMREGCNDAAIAFAEVPVGSQSARAMASYGACMMLLAACPIPLIQVTPTEAKVAATGIKTATKGEMIEWAMKRHPKAPWKMRRSKGALVPTNDNEHLADACATIEAGIRTPEFKAAMRLFAASAVSQH